MRAMCQDISGVNLSTVTGWIVFPSSGRPVQNKSISVPLFQHSIFSLSIHLFIYFLTSYSAKTKCTLSDNLAGVMPRLAREDFISYTKDAVEDASATIYSSYKNKNKKKVNINYTLQQLPQCSGVHKGVHKTHLQFQSNSVCTNSQM